MKKANATAMKTLEFPFTIQPKTLTDTGSFSGYASVFGNVDFGGDIVERGAFREIMTTKDGMVRVLFQHDMRQLVGKAKVTPDEKGLKVDGHLILGIAQARNVYEMMKASILDGLSIGYDVLANGSQMTQDGNRRLTGLKLYEISLVTFGMNELATVDNVKEIRPGMTKRETEKILRDVGFSSAQAKALTSGWKEPTESSQRDVGDAAAEAAKKIGSFDVTGKCADEIGSAIHNINSIRF